MSTPKPVRTVRSLAGVAAVLAACAGAWGQARLHVNVAQTTDDGPGTSWETAYKELRTALANAPTGEVEIWVATGTYLPTPEGGSREASFVIPSGARVRGGFTGVETSPEQRPAFSANRTVLEGRIFGSWRDRTSHVVRVSGAAPGTLLDRVQISGGSVPSSFSGNAFGGGGVLVSGGHLDMTGCWVLGNLSGLWVHGAGMDVRGGATVRLADCELRENRSGPYGHGGAIFVSGGSSLTMDTCVFFLNWAEPGVTGQSGFGASGGAVAMLDASVTARGCSFGQNRAGDGGGGVFGSFAQNGGAGGAGGAIRNFSGTLRLDQCIFLSNAAGNGGEASTTGQGTPGTAGAGGNGGAVSGRADAVNCLFAYNRAGAPGAAAPGGFPGSGGRASAVMGAGLTAGTVVNCTFLLNAGGLVVEQVGEVRNSLVWANTFLSGGVPSVALHAGAVSYCNVQGTLPPGPGNISADPMLDAGGNPFAPGAGSPCIDAGDNGAVPAGVSQDLARAARFTDDPAAPDTGAGRRPIVDMGCYERPGETPGFADFNGNGAVDVADVFTYLGAWFAQAPSADVDADTGVSVADIFGFLARWFAWA